MVYTIFYIYCIDLDLVVLYTCNVMIQFSKRIVLTCIASFFNWHVCHYSSLCIYFSTCRIPLHCAILCFAWGIPFCFVFKCKKRILLMCQLYIHLTPYWASNCYQGGRQVLRIVVVILVFLYLLMEIAFVFQKMERRS